MPQASLKSLAHRRLWHKDTACTQPWDFNDGITGSMTLYVKWIPIGTVTATVTATVTQTAQPTQ
ncbi:MAG TPA: hypothetical protein O0X20_03170 [Methanocorpusculum sp.]|nr:hypothetical protein [Methanocorpusculum sp.]